ncbi:MAG TPA: hypothetical protein VGG65_09730, partial [Thermoanaerobaculia bacterium]
QVFWVSFFPDGKHILFEGVEPGRGPRLYVQEIPAGVPRSITPEGFTLTAMTRAVSPDGRSALAVGAEDGATWIWPVHGGQARRVDAIDPKRERPVRWTADGQGLYVREWHVLPFEISRLDLSTGRKTPWKRIAPSDPAGTADTPLVRLSADGDACLYSMDRKLFELYVVDGLR